MLHEVRRGTNPDIRLRAHILLLLHQQLPWTMIVAVLFTSAATINRWRRRYLHGGLAAILQTKPPRPRRWSCFLALVLHWVTLRSPRDFGFFRSRWTCATVVALLDHDDGIRPSRETVRRWLHQGGLVWRRPRPVPGPKDPHYAQKLRTIRALLRDLPPDQVAFFMDEVDINTNPKIGAMWMQRGQQAVVQTPGINTKRYLAGSMHWRTGELILSEPGCQRNADLFLRHLDDLRRRFRRYRRIHVICDNAIFHRPERCRKVREYLAQWGDRIVLHFLPTYAPETNPIERVWWHLHEEITRNHRCRDIEELLDLIFDWSATKRRFAIETSVYDSRTAA
ncbi:MAG TPA: IS630 family transposase [Gemmataceae bacterium]|nr:IS630 family transposase [Gemmataceae bacterium]